jgi:anti-sigma factor RsiW
VSAAIGYYAGASGTRISETGDGEVVERALQAHVMYAAEKLHVVEVGADQKDHLVGWLSKRVGVPLVAPDFSAERLQLMGGRLLPAAGNAAAQFMYQDRAGTRISLYVTADAKSSETGFRLYEEDGARTFYWIDGGFCYAVSGGVPEKTLLDLANAAYRQLLDGAAS